MNQRLAPLLAAALLTCSSAVHGYVFIEGFPAWPDATVTLELQLGNSPVYSDGTTPNGTAIQAIAQWNPSMARLQLTYVNNSTATKSKTNLKNNVFFDSKFYGTAFPEGVLAVTTGRVDASGPIEMDVIVNTVWAWDAYRGELQYPKPDLRRVLAHEFGHVLSLDHPDQHGQWTSALMNAYMSDIDTTQQDDKDGASARYGHGPGNPAQPPVFPYWEPYDATVLAGSPASFYAWVTGTQPIELQWLKDGEPLPGRTTNSLQFNAVSLADAGRYSLRATNTGGSATSREATLTVLVPEPPTILSHPASLTVQHSGSFQLWVSATSNAPISFQWTRDNVAIPDATYSTFGLDNVQPSHAGEYRVVLTTAGGSVTSNAATITVIPATPPVVTRNPAGATVEEGSSVQFSADFASAVPVTYQWTHDTVAIPGATSPWFQLAAVRAADAGDYRLVATNAGGSTATAPAKLTVVPTVPPMITSHPQGVEVEVGAPLYLAAAAQSGVPMTYQWTKDGVPIAGAQSAGFSRAAAALSDAGDYRFVATNSAGSVASDPATVTVVPTRLPVFRAHPRDATVEEGSHIYLSAWVASAVPVTLQWVKDDIPIAGATHEQHYLYDVASTQAGTYRLIATNAAGSVSSEPAVVTITPAEPPHFVVHPESITLEEGAALSLHAWATSPRPVNYQWTRNGVAIPAAIGEFYSVSPVTASQAGEYALRASNAVGTATSRTAVVTIVPPTLPVITAHPGSRTVQKGTYVDLSVSYQSNVPATVQWLKDDAAIPGATNTYLGMGSVTEASAGTYIARVTNPAGTVASNPAVLTVVPTQPPKFSMHPAGGVSEVGSYRAFHVTVESAVGFTVQWTKDGAPVPGATSSSLYLERVSTADAGVYRAVATNTAGTTTSNAALLKVVPLRPPVITAHPQPFTGQVGGFGSFSVSAVSAAPMTFQWRHNGTPMASGTWETVWLNPLREDHAGTYDVVVTNAAGSTTSLPAEATVIPAQPPRFVTHPTDTTAEQGGFFSLWAEVYSVLPVTYRWHKNGEPIPGATDTSFTRGSVTNADAGAYTLVATNSVGSTTSMAAQVTVTPPGPPRFVRQPIGRHAVAGSYIFLHAYAESASPVTYQWFKDGVPLDQATDGNVSISAATLADAGVYVVRASNLHGSTDSDPAAIVITSPPPPPPALLRNVSLPAGTYLLLNPAQPINSGTIAYQWYHDGVALPGATSGMLQIQGISREQAGEYFCTTTNEAGTTTSTTSLVRVEDNLFGNEALWGKPARAGQRVFLPSRRTGRIDRFDLGSDAELPAISLNAPASAIAATPEHLFVATGLEIVRMNHDGSGFTPFALADGSVLSMEVAAGRLVAIISTGYLNPIIRIVHYRTSDAALLAISPALESATSALAITPDGGRVYGGSYGYAHTGLIALDILPDGSFGPVVKIPSDQFHPVPESLTLHPVHAWVFDHRGMAYTTDDMQPFASIGTPPASLDFTASGQTVALRGRVVSIYDDTLCLERRLRLAKPASAVFVDGTDVVALAAMSGGATNVGFERLPLQPPVGEAPAAVPHPSAVAFLPDAVETDRDGNLLLLSRRHQALFRWNIREQRYTDAIPLGGFPNALACIRPLNTAYVAFADQSIMAVSLDGTPVTRSVGAVPWEIRTLLATDDRLIVVSWDTVAVLGSEGELLTVAPYSIALEETAWSAVDRRLYLSGISMYTQMLQAMVLDEMDQFGEPQWVVSAVTDISRPWPPFMRAAPDGQSLALSSGQVLDLSTTPPRLHVCAPFSDATWQNGAMFVVGDTTSGAVVRRLDAALSVTGQLALGGHALRVFPAGGDRLVVMTSKAGKVLFTLLNESLAVQRHFTSAPDLTRVRLANLSTRGSVGTGESIMIAGFVVTGSGPKRVLVRAVGPTLGRFGVSGALADPVLTLVADSGTIAENDNWFTPDGPALKEAFREVYAFSLPETSLDAALVATLSPGKYTAQVSGKNDTSGVALVEAYDLDADAGERRLINISTRATVGVGDQVLIPGLVVIGSEPKRLLIRAVGPELARFKVSDALADPSFAVINRDNEIVAANDNWGEDNTEATAAAGAAASAFRLTEGSRDAALVATLAPGSYTVVVSGVGDTSGVALVEVYEVP